MGALAARAFTLNGLKKAWADVLANDAEDGSLSHGVSRFAEDLDERLTTLAAALVDHSWEPGNLTPVTITVGEKQRELHIPAVEDRIVARAMLAVGGPLADAHLGPAAYAYRTGLGVADAVHAVVALRSEGLTHVLRTDVRDCFPSLPKDLAGRRLAALLDDPALTRLIDLLLARAFRAPTGGLRTLSGVPQGCPLSPLLANLVLVDLDDALQCAGHPVVRYGDDLLVAARTAADAWEAARTASRITEELGMKLNATKTRVTSFDEGFTFLGEDFGPRYPPTLDDHRVAEPDQRALYVGLQGGRVSISQGRIKVNSKDDTTVLDVPSSQVARVVCFGSVGLTSGVRAWALSNDVDVVLASRNGNYLGTMLSHGRRYRPARLRAQLALQDSAHGLAVARAIVEAKITKQRVLLLRFGRRPVPERVVTARQQIESLTRMLPGAQTVDELMGLEGAAAQAYFPALGQLVPEPLAFTERSRQPPQDVINAALSYLYTILLGECVTALHAAGLDPAFGVLHRDQENRPSLALDLMEEFRPYLVDQVVVEAARHGRLTAQHGRREGTNGILLTKEGRTVVVDGYERRLLRQTSGALPEFTGTLRRHIYRQAQRVRAAIMDPSVAWTGLSWRP